MAASIREITLTSWLAASAAVVTVAGVWAKYLQATSRMAASRIHEIDQKQHEIGEAEARAWTSDSFSVAPFLRQYQRLEDARWEIRERLGASNRAATLALVFFLLETGILLVQGLSILAGSSSTFLGSSFVAAGLGLAFCTAIFQFYHLNRLCAP